MILTVSQRAIELGISYLSEKLKTDLLPTVSWYNDKLIWQTNAHKTKVCALSMGQLLYMGLT